VYAINILHKNAFNSQLLSPLSLLGGERQVSACTRPSIGLSLMDGLVQAETSRSPPNKERRKNSWVLTEFLCKILKLYLN
jgi:hypothetical protein